jgi:single-strand DNA-binding protein
MLAKVQGLFRLTRDAELRYSNNGSAILKLGLACSEKFKDKETQLFLDAVAFSKPAEIINQYSGAKGSQLFLCGKLETQQWEDQQGQKRSKVSMTIESFEFVGSRDNNQQPQQSQQQYNQNPPVQYEHNGQNQGNYNPSQIPQIDIDEDEIPFNQG